MTSVAATASAPRQSRVVRWASLLGLLSLAYLLGAAVMFFELPSSLFLRRAFVGGVAWYEARPEPPASQEPSPPSVGQVDKPDKTCDGFTLCMYGGNSQAILVDMHGTVVHRWHVPFSQVWPDPPHLRGPIGDAAVYFNDGHVYANGDLVVVIEGPIDGRNPSNGFGLARLDRDSRVLWKYAEKCHHDLDVGEDGTIYAIANETVRTVPKGLERIPTPCLVDVIHVVSPEGKTLKKIPILEAIHDSPYAALLGAFERPGAIGAAPPGPGAARSPVQDDLRNRDVLHTNAIRVLNHSLAPKFRLFKPGQLLISPRHLDAIAVVDPDSGKAVWAARSVARPARSIVPRQRPAAAVRQSGLAPRLAGPRIRSRDPGLSLVLSGPERQALHQSHPRHVPAPAQWQYTGGQFRRRRGPGSHRRSGGGMVLFLRRRRIQPRPAVHAGPGAFS